MKGKQSKARAQIEDMAATIEILGAKREEYVEEDKEGNFVFLSPEGSVVGEEDVGKEIDSGGGAGGSKVLPIREEVSSHLVLLLRFESQSGVHLQLVILLFIHPQTQRRSIPPTTTTHTKPFSYNGSHCSLDFSNRQNHFKPVLSTICSPAISFLIPPTLNQVHHNQSHPPHRFLQQYSRHFSSPHPSH